MDIEVTLDNHVGIVEIKRPPNTKADITQIMKIRLIGIKLLMN